MVTLDNRIISLSKFLLFRTNCALQSRRFSFHELNKEKHIAPAVCYSYFISKCTCVHFHVSLRLSFFSSFYHPIQFHATRSRSFVHFSRAALHNQLFLWTSFAKSRENLLQRTRVFCSLYNIVFWKFKNKGISPTRTGAVSRKVWSNIIYIYAAARAAISILTPSQCYSILNLGQSLYKYRYCVEMYPISN